MAIAAASVRLAASSLPRMFDTWTPAVFSLMNSRSAIWRFVRPAATCERTSRSRAVSPNRFASILGDGGSRAAGSPAPAPEPTPGTRRLRSRSATGGPAR